MAHAGKSVAGNIVDLFCGAGGFSLGAHLAGFKTAAAIDIDPTLTSSYTENFPDAKLLRSDIREITGRDILDTANLKSSDIAGIVGGPPCQGFSLIGKRSTSDPRNELVGHFFRIVADLLPPFFIMENVPGLLKGDAKSVLDQALEGIKGYELVGPLILDACEFGAATHRERVIVLGYRKQHVDQITESDIAKAKSSALATVKDAITDIPEPSNKLWVPYRKCKGVLSAYAKRARTLPASKHLGSQLYLDRLAEGKVADVRPTNHAEDVVLRFKQTLPGKSDSISRCPRLNWSTPAPTLRAGTGPDRGSFQSIRPIHPSSHRVITVREAARLQGFPDWFKFHDTKWHSFRMIGNSVSPYIAQSLLEMILSRTAHVAAS